MNRLLTISPSPHLHQGDSVERIMYRVILALAPALLWSFFAFGLPAVFVTMVSVIACVSIEWLIQKYLLKTTPTIFDGSAIITGILLAMNLPSSVPVWIVVIGAIAAIGIGKMSFGGLGQNPFNPALVGRVFLLISFPVQMTSWPNITNNLVDATTQATPLAILKDGIKNGISMNDLMASIPNYFDLFIGKANGSLGEVSEALLLVGLVYMLIKKVITWHIPISIMGTIFLLSGILWMTNPEHYADPVFHILTGGAMLAAIFMATDMVTSPMSKSGQLVFGIGIGILTVCIRNWGSYPEGISYAILIMNGFTPLINNYLKPKRFGEAK